MSTNKKLLAGVKVIELANFIAAPACGRFFADAGAEVIKIETPAGDPLRYTAPTEGRPLSQEANLTFDLENANKKCVVLNLRSDKGREAFFKLLDDADILLTNWRPGALERAGFDYETLKQKYPALVYAMIAGYGEKGPDANLPGFDYTAFFARGGILGTLYEKGTSPMNPIPGLGDHQAGMFLAAGTMAALYKAKMTGEGEKVTVGLFQSAMYTIGIMLQAAQYPDHGNPYPMNARNNMNPLISAHRTSDDYFIQICMPPYDPFYDKFMTCIGREDLVGDERYNTMKNLGNKGAEVYDIIAEAMVNKTKNEWEVIFRENDIPFATAQLWEDLLKDEQAWANDYFYEMNYPNGEKKALVRLPFTYEEMGLPDYKQSSQLGGDTKEVLKELGYSEDEIHKMAEEKEILLGKQN